jgi:hypothetical protein
MLRSAVRSLNCVPFILLVAFSIGLASCGAMPDLREVAPDYIAQPPDRGAEARVMGHVEFPPPAPEVPGAPRFEIAFDNVHRCHRRNFITFRVENTGEAAFNWASQWLIYSWRVGASEQHAMSRYDIQKPFMLHPRSCPRAQGHRDRLEPGEIAYVGLFLTFDFDEVEIARFGGRSWEDITNVTFYVELHPTSFPLTAGSQSTSLDITSETEPEHFGDYPGFDRAEPYDQPEVSSVEAEGGESVITPRSQETIPPGTAPLPSPMPPRP